MICDNCGHEEDTGLGDVEFEEEVDEFIEENDDTDDVVLTDDIDEIFEEIEDEITLPKVEPVKEIHTEDLFSLDEEVTPIQTIPDVKVFNQKIVDFAGKFYADSELESSNIIEKDTFTVVELNTNELFVL
jgi:hypothetical protein